MKRKQTKISSFFEKRPRIPLETPPNSQTPSSPIQTNSFENSENLENTPPDSENDLTFLRPQSETPRKVLQPVNDFFKEDDDFFVNFLSPEETFENSKLSPAKNSQSHEDKLLSNLNIDLLLNDFRLTFDKPRRCLIVKTEFKHFEQILHVKEKETSDEGICYLRDMWAFNINVKPNDIVCISAISFNNQWLVDSQHGYVVIYPDTLISSTTIVNSMYCRRKGVLSGFFKGLGEENKVMFVGQLVHEILQSALKNNSDHLNQIIDDVLKNPKSLRAAFACGFDSKTLKKELFEYIPQVKSFLKMYLKHTETPIHFQGTIVDVIDIEENISSRNLGVKGRIDVTSTVRINHVNKLMPIEIKTGRASFSTEHKSQVALYIMMMTDLGRQVESGLLVYLKENYVGEVTPGRPEIRDLILLRNHLAQYLSKSFDLPDPLNRISGCAKCQHINVCKSYLNDDHPLREYGSQLLQSHIDYFNLWTKLLVLENPISQPHEDLVVESENDRIYRFKSSKFLKLNIGTTVQIKSKNHFYSGVVLENSKSSLSCVLQLDKKLEDLNIKYTLNDFKTNFLNMYLTNLGVLLDENYSKFREIMIEGKTATFEKINKSILTPSCVRHLHKLNSLQQRAVVKSISANDYLLIKGPPGTGKTQTICTLIKILLELKQTILLTSHTNAAVDNILKRISDLNFLRLGSLKSIHPTLHENCYETLKSSCQSVEELAELFDRQIIATTCVGLDGDLVTKKQFDICIIDEASQVLQPESLKPIFSAKKFILIGDPNQLPPVVTNLEAKKLGMDISIFERLFNPECSVVLKQQYRMNETLMNLANDLVYGGNLEIGDDFLKHSSLSVDLKFCQKWIQEICSSDIEKSFIFVDTSEYLEKYPDKCSSNSNQVEANILKIIIETFLKSDILEKEIGVIAPFRAQIDILKKMTNNVDVNTVDQYQGRDKEIILYSCVKQDRRNVQKDEFEILNDMRRLTVALTRAKKKLIVVGDKETLLFYKPFSKLFSILKNYQIVCLQDGIHEFAWEKVVCRN